MIKVLESKTAPFGDHDWLDHLVNRRLVRITYDVTTNAPVYLEQEIDTEPHDEVGYVHKHLQYVQPEEALSIGEDGYMQTQKQTAPYTQQNVIVGTVTHFEKAQNITDPQYNEDLRVLRRLFKLPELSMMIGFTGCDMPLRLSIDQEMTVEILAPDVA